MAESAPEHPMFSIIKSAAVGGGVPRVGRLILPKRTPLDTPNYIGISSRGVIPHLTPDVVSKHTDLDGVYMGLEDFMERSKERAEPAIFGINADEGDALHVYTATPTPIITVLGARRHPAVVAPTGNGKDYISIYTSTGFQKLKTDEYHRVAVKLQPDVTIPLADLTFGYSHMRTKLPNAKRQLRMVERTEDWLVEFIKLNSAYNGDVATKPRAFAPLLPVDYPTQWEYINRLAQGYIEQISGLAVYDADVLSHLGEYDSLSTLPRLSMDFITSPHEILRQVQLGLDIFTVSFLNSISDAGIALTFSFPSQAPSVSGEPLPLGINMWSQDHQVSLKPLVEGCQCYACTKHHRAYLHHLLNAKEMLGWTLLQTHNHHILSGFFKGIRASLAAEPSTFERDCDVFAKTYESELPKGTGERPRARGYHFKPQAGQPRINARAWEKYDDGVVEDPVLAGEMAKLAVIGSDIDGVGTPLATDVDTEASKLDKKDFADVES
ncbi:tRNA-guanine transglycosylase [Durotheca rogersii]|uniref:tRNA-guanine transglycosylase n=1 Tax=Durotheca rogersii TaxID=419775 RepID=UPI00221F88E5|nr:tRNA-guanine transglycosylase [Durotheca rogersii]KAI5859422.1 tRNA-guanine transglycosylase [Durotheca rogersii]